MDGTNVNTAYTKKSVEELAKVIEESSRGIIKAYEEIIEAVRQYHEKENKDNPYAIMIEASKKFQEELNAELGSYKDVQEKRLEIDRWYNAEYKKLQDNKQNLSNTAQGKAFADLEQLYQDRKNQATIETWQNHGEEIGQILSRSYDKILTEYQNFGDTMKGISTDIANYLIEESIRAVVQQIFATQKMQGFVGAMKGFSGGGGIFSNVLQGLGKGLGLFHTGGVVPVGANMEIPGTREQLALLKGGERILSPGENASYNSNQQTSPVIINNYNIKAWDSKDVRQYLLDNKQLLNQITYEGIKNNNNHLRSIVQNA